MRGRRVAIWGIGMLGIVACAICRERGAGEIVAIDINRERLALAGRFGATRTCLPDDKALADLRADVTIDYSGRIESMEATVSRCWQKYPIAELIHDGFPLSRAEEAFRYAIDRNPFRVGIRC